MSHYPRDIHETAHWHGAVVRHPVGDLLRIEALEGYPSLTLSVEDASEIRDILDALQPRVAQGIKPESEGTP